MAKNINLYTTSISHFIFTRPNYSRFYLEIRKHTIFGNFCIALYFLGFAPKIKSYTVCYNVNKSPVANYTSTVSSLHSSTLLKVNQYFKTEHRSIWNVYSIYSFIITTIFTQTLRLFIWTADYMIQDACSRVCSITVLINYLAIMKWNNAIVRARWKNKL